MRFANYSRLDSLKCGSIAIELTNSAIPVELVNVELKCDEAKVLRIFDLQSRREPGRGPRAINKNPMTQVTLKDRVGRRI